MNSFVPFNSPGRALSIQHGELLALTSRVFDSGWLVHGPEHRAFEDALAEFVGARHALGVASGTDALEIALRSARTDERTVVLTVANAGAYATTAARAAGYDVRFCDVDPETHLIDRIALEAALDDRVFAVVVTHLYGRLADVAAIRELCAPRGVTVIEDCAQAIGARGPLGAAGSLGDLATFSFYPTKNLGALGDGGAVTTSDDGLANRVRELRQYGWSEKYLITRTGGRNSRLDELQAAFLAYRLPFVDVWNRTRRGIIVEYGAAAPAAVRVLPAVDETHCGHLAVVITEDAAALARHLSDHGIQTAVHYPVPDHHQPALRSPAGAVSLPQTERLVGRILSLPCFPELTRAEVDQVCEGLASYRPAADPVGSQKGLR